MDSNEKKTHKHTICNQIDYDTYSTKNKREEIFDETNNHTKSTCKAKTLMSLKICLSFIFFLSLLFSHSCWDTYASHNIMDQSIFCASTSLRVFIEEKESLEKAPSSTISSQCQVTNMLTK